ncbi:EamA family transporter [Halomarina oriensis]|uniref:EamA family transporter n=1 Tax=Halomarina oriensis TaxID=671145 RepID=A0A6B0GWH1_9EURY|nr:EamA family transporter [Halomarina oriensis]MWG36923.1 EamA family transporter [Halomarina oriensis]
MVEFSNAYTYAVGALLLWGVWGIAANYSVERMDNMAVLLVTYLVGVGVVLALDPGAFGGVEFDAGLALSVLTGLAMSLGTVLFYRALDLGQLSGVTAIPALYFVVAFAYGVLVLGEPVSASQVAGVGLACVAVLLLVQ